MAVVDQPRTTYSDTNIARRVISESIALIDPTDTPFLSKFPPGSAEQKFSIVRGGTKIEWLEDVLATTSDTLAAAVTNTTDTTFTVTDASVWKVGDNWLIDNEVVWVSAVNTTSNTVTVLRNQGGTAATHASTAAASYVSNSRLEGATTDYGQTTTLVNPYNYTQIFQDAVKVTRSQEKLLQHGISDELDYQRDKKVKELNRSLEKALIFQLNLRAAGSASTPRRMGSLATFITTSGNYRTTTTTIQKADVDNTMLACFQDGGNPRLLMANPSTLLNLRNLIDSSSFVKVSQDERSIGMRIERVVTQYGELELLPNRWLDAHYAFLLDPDFIGVYEYDPWSEEDLGKVGDYRAREIVGEFSLVVQQGNKAHGLIYSSNAAGL